LNRALDGPRTTIVVDTRLKARKAITINVPT